MQELSRELARLGAQEPNIQLRADTMAASAQLAGVGRQVRHLDGQTARISVNANEVSRAITVVGLLTTGVSVLGAAVVPAAAALAALPAAAAGGLQVAGALGAGFVGVGDALQEMESAEKSAATTATSAASSQVAAMERIGSASRAVENAERQRHRTAVQGAQQVVDARRAEEQATDSLRDAQEDLSRAYEEARERQQDLSLDLRDNALAQRDAALDLREAQAALAEGRATGVVGDDLQRLENNAERAQLRVDQLTERMGDLQAQQARGVAGDEQVIAARERVAEAERGVEDAALRTARAQQQAAWANQDAAAAVVDAQRQLQSALAQTGEVGAASANKVAFAMAQLSPAGQSFARFIHGELKPALRGIGHDVQAAMLPDLEVSLRNLIGLTPVFSAGLSETGNVIGRLAVRGSELMASGPWRDDFATIMASNNRSLEGFGSAGLELADVFRSITVASLPLVERFAAFTESSSEAFNAWIQGARTSGEMSQFFTTAGDTLARLGGIAGQVALAALRVTEAVGPMGLVILETVGEAAELVGKLAEAHPLLIQVAAASVLAGSGFIKAAQGLAAFKTIMIASGIADFTGKLRGAQTAAGGFAAAAAGPAGMNAALTGTATAAGVAGGAATRLGGALGSVAGKFGVVALGLVGGKALWDGLSGSVDRANAELNKGGAAADEMNRKMREEAFSIENLIGAFSPLNFILGGEFVPASALATAAAEKQRDAMDANFHANMRLRNSLAEVQAQLLANSDADFAYRQALQGVTDQLNALNTSQGISYSQSLQLEGSMRTAAEAARQKALAHYEDKNSVDAVRAGHLAFNQELAQLIVQAGTDAPAALVNYIASLHSSQLQALGARVEADHFGNRVLWLDGLNASVPVTTPGLPEGTHRVNELHQSILALRALGTTTATIMAEVLYPTPGPPPITGIAVRGRGGIARPLAMQVGGGLMPRGIAQVVPPNQPVVMGDRMRGNESYIPWDRSPRSLGILSTTAQAMGFGLVPLAAGGILGMQRGGVVGGGAAGDDPAAALGALGETAQNLASTGLAPLAAELTDQTVPALQLLALHAGTHGTAAVAALAASLPPLTTATQVAGQLMRDQWALNTGAVQTAGMLMGQAQLAWQNLSNTSWAHISAVTGFNIGQITGPIFGGLHTGLHGVNTATANTVAFWRHQLDLMRAAAADPIRWAIQFPMGAPGIVGAWNHLDGQFALGKHVQPFVPGFASGGKVPGAGSGDTVPAMLTPGEYVIPKPVVNRWGLDNIARAHQATLTGRFHGLDGMFTHPDDRLVPVRGYQQGGVVADTGGQMTEAIRRGLDFARAQHGKPYIWAGVGPTGYDCSGFMSAIANVLMGRYPHARLGSTGSAPWAGWAPGLTSAFGVGWFTDNPGHMAGTLQGNNVEAGDSPSRTKFVQQAAGATHPQFRRHMSLPVVGGRFIAGGPGGFDPGPVVEDAFRRTYELIAEGRRRWPGLHGGRGFDISQQGADRVKRVALDRIMAMMSAGVGHITGPVVDQVRQVAMRYGWHQGPQWDCNYELVDRESSWNPNARNPRSSAAGLYQKMQSIHGPVEPTAAGRAEWGLNYIRGRYGDPCRALAHHDRNNW